MPFFVLVIAGNLLIVGFASHGLICTHCCPVGARAAETSMFAAVFLQPWQVLLSERSLQQFHLTFFLYPSQSVHLIAAQCIVATVKTEIRVL